jgi:hypothetical protein
MSLLYLAVGLAFVPAGLLYALAQLVGWGNWAVAAVFLGLGFLMAHFVWGKLEKRLTAGVRRSAMGEAHDDLQEGNVRIVIHDSPLLVRLTSSVLADQPTTTIEYIGKIPMPQRTRTEPTQSLAMEQA